MTGALLQVIGLRTHFRVRRGFLSGRKAALLRAVDGVGFCVRRGEVLGLVGESGSGKSTLARTILRLVPPTAGQIVFDGVDFTALRGAALRRARTGMQMVFQDPNASLDPSMTILETLAEPLLVHRRVSRAEAPAAVAGLMERVGLPPRAMHRYPHEFSGGQRQRIAIARALALRPKLLVADEPVSSLDVSVQAQILNLLARLVRETGSSMLFIAHDLAVVKHVSDRVAVLYAGRIVEIGGATDVIERPRHPYAKALAAAMPRCAPEPAHAGPPAAPAGDPPSPFEPPAGCAYHPRCPHAAPACRSGVPPLVRESDSREVACVRLAELDR
jgi:oligopeptide transport system ATP-binding protein